MVGQVERFLASLRVNLRESQLVYNLELRWVLVLAYHMGRSLASLRVHHW